MTPYPSGRQRQRIAIAPPLLRSRRVVTSRSHGAARPAMRAVHVDNPLFLS